MNKQPGLLSNFLLIFGSCLITFFGLSRLPKQSRQNFVILGDKTAKKTWIYLSGLTSDFNTAQEKSHRAFFNQLGLDQQLCVIAIRPWAHSQQFGDQWCWPHETTKQTLQTYQKIKNMLPAKQTISGWIGFSNGGFFLHQLVQQIALQSPVITIGAAGGFAKAKVSNQLHMLIGQQDQWHYDHAKNFFSKAKNSALDVELIEYAGGHVLPQDLLRKLLAK